MNDEKRLQIIAADLAKKSEYLNAKEIKLNKLHSTILKLINTLNKK